MRPECHPLTNAYYEVTTMIGCIALTIILAVSFLRPIAV